MARESGYDRHLTVFSPQGRLYQLGEPPRCAARERGNLALGRVGVPEQISTPLRRRPAPASPAPPQRRVRLQAGEDQHADHCGNARRGLRRCGHREEGPGEPAAWLPPRTPRRSAGNDPPFPGAPLPLGGFHDSVGAAAAAGAGVFRLAGARERARGLQPPGAELPVCAAAPRPPQDKMVVASSVTNVYKITDSIMAVMTGVAGEWLARLPVAQTGAGLSQHWHSPPARPPAARPRAWLSTLASDALARVCDCSCPGAQLTDGRLRLRQGASRPSFSSTTASPSRLTSLRAAWRTRPRCSRSTPGGAFFPSW